MRWLFILVFVSLQLQFCSALSLHEIKYDFKIKRAVDRYWGDFPKWEYLKAQLYQESLLNPNATSPVGAMGLAQFMPDTWEDVRRELHFSKDKNAYMPHYSIIASAYYMRKLRNAWSYKRPIEQKHFLALASYNAGLGNILKAQVVCKSMGLNYMLWEDIKICLPNVTGKHSKETIEYVKRIKKWYGSQVH